MRVDHKNSDLKTGEFIELVDVDDVPHGLHVQIERLLYPADGVEGIAVIPHYRRVRDTFMASIVTGWSFGDLPRDEPAFDPTKLGDPERLYALGGRVYKVLRKATDPHYIDAGFMTDPAEREEKKTAS